MLGELLLLLQLVGTVLKSKETSATLIKPTLTQCYVAASYITSDCRVLMEALNEISEACTVVTVLTSRLKLCLKPT